MLRRRRISIYPAMLLTILFSILLSSPARAADTPILDRAGSHLKQNPVYVDAGSSDQLTPAQIAELGSIVHHGNVALFLAVLPTAVRFEVAGERVLATSVAKHTRLNGIYAVVSGPVFRVTSVPAGSNPSYAGIASRVYGDYSKDGAYAMLKQFATQMEGVADSQVAAVSDNPLITPPPSDPPKGNHMWLYTVLGLLALISSFVILYVVRTTKPKSDSHEAEWVTYQTAPSAPRDDPPAHALQANRLPSRSNKPQSARPAPLRMTNRTIINPRYESYGYYPGTGWGYYDPNGSFVEGVIEATVLNSFDDRLSSPGTNDDQASYAAAASADDSGGGSWDVYDTSASGSSGASDEGGSSSNYTPPSQASDSGGGGWDGDFGSSYSSSDSGSGGGDYGGGGDSGGDYGGGD